VTNYHSTARTKESRFRGTLDDVIIIPLVLVTLAVNKILRFILSILMRLLDYAFPLAMQIVWLPLFAARLGARSSLPNMPSSGQLRSFVISAGATGVLALSSSLPITTRPPQRSTHASTSFLWQA
jgi:hypothetical protein